MKQNRSTPSRARGFSIVEVLLVILVVAALGVGGLYLWHRSHKSNPTSHTPTQSTTSKSQSKPVSDPSEGGRYLYIKEWSTRIALPADIQGDVTYSLGDTAADPDGNQIQAAKILVKKGSFADNVCSTVSSTLGDAIDSEAQYIRSEASKPFDATRYRWTFKENILKSGAFNYHLNYVTPDCLGGGTNDAIMQELQISLVSLKKVD